MQDPVGDRMKALERAGAGAVLDPHLPVYVRIDGRAFSRFTKGMERPFDARMTNAMHATAAHLLTHTQAVAAFVQSDEISLAWHLTDDKSELFFGGKPQKMVSVLAGMATAAFTAELVGNTSGLAAYADRLPHFDARVCQIPSRAETREMFAWRGDDARRNAILSLARAHYSPKFMHRKSTGHLLALLDADGIRLDTHPQAAVNGTLMTNHRELRRMSQDERLAIPEAYRPAADAEISRRTLRYHSDAPLATIANLEEVIFDGASPVVRPRPLSLVDPQSVG